MNGIPCGSTGGQGCQFKLNEIAALWGQRFPEGRFRSRPNECRVQGQEENSAAFFFNDGGHRARDLGEGTHQGGGATAVSAGDRGGRARLGAGRTWVSALQRAPGCAGRERVLLL